MSAEDKTVLDGEETVLESEATLYEATLYDAAVNGNNEKPSDNSEIKKGNIILDTYLIDSDTIKGGMGSVWRVHHNNWNVDLAMKRPLPKFFSGEDSKKNYIQECETWISMGLHPNVVSCYYVREIYGVPTIFSEWMNGGSLDELIKSEKLYSGNETEQKKRILDIAIQFARGLNYAHNAGIIHQDVKPANLMMNKDGEAKVTDFGLAKARAVLTVYEGDFIADNGATLFSESGGYTPAYCSMEQMDGKVLTRKTDIYSWAVSVMEMYIGKRLWANGVVAGLNCQEFLEQTRVSMPESMKDLLRKCLDSKPENRPQNFTEIESELKEIYRAETDDEYPRLELGSASETADSLNNQALSFLDLGKTFEAERLFDKAQTLDRNNLNVIYNRLLLLWRTGKINDLEVLGEFISSKQNIANSSESDYLLAQIYLECGKGEKALELLKPLEDQYKTESEYLDCVDKARSYKFEQTERERRDKQHYIFNRFVCSKDEKLDLVEEGKNTVLKNENLPLQKQKITLDISPDNVIEACFSDDGKFAAVVNKFGYVVQVFDTTAGRVVRKSACKYSAVAGGLRFSGQGRYLVSFSVDKTACICDMNNNFKLIACLKFDEVPYGHIAVSPDGKLAVAGFNSGRISTYRVSTGEKIRDYRVGISNVEFTEISPNKKFAVCCCKDGIAYIIRLSNGQCVYSVDRSNQKPILRIKEVEFSPDGKRLIYLTSVPDNSAYPYEVIQELPDFDYNGALRLARIKNSESRIKETREFERNLSLAQEAYYKKLYSDVLMYLDKARSVKGMQYDKRICELNEKIKGHANCVGIRSSWKIGTFEVCTQKGAKTHDMDASVNGLLIADCGDKFHTKIIDCNTGEDKFTIDFPGKSIVSSIVIDLRFSHDGKKVLGVMQNKIVKLWDAETGKYEGGFYEENVQWHPNCTIFSPDGNYVLISNLYGFSVWDSKSKRHIRDVICDGETKNITFDKSGKKVMVLSKTLSLWDFQTGNLIKNYGDVFNTYTVAISPDNRTFVAGIKYGKAAIFDIKTGNQIKLLNIDGDNWGLDYACYIQNGRLIALRYGGKSLTVCDSETGECVYSFNNFGQHDVITTVMSPDGQYLYASHEDGTVTRWYIDYIYETGSFAETVFEEENDSAAEVIICRDCKKPFIAVSPEDDLCDECKKKRADVLDDILKLFN